MTHFVSQREAKPKGNWEIRREREKRKGGMTGAEKGGLNNSASGLARFHLSVDRSLHISCRCS